jgi:hypothetical protein
MALIRVVVTLALLMLCFAPLANAQSPVGPLCLRVENDNPSSSGDQLFEIFALPMGTTSSGASQFLLSAVRTRFTGDIPTPFSGTAAVRRIPGFVGQVASFTLTRYQGAGTPPTLEAFGGFVTLSTGTGTGHCSRTDWPGGVGACGEGDSVDYTLVDCE